MAVKIRLKRMGKIRAPYYRIVVADSRTKRDGRVIEEIGKYHPTEEPSVVEIKSDRAQYWLGVGAQPTEQVAVLLKLTGDWGIFKGDKDAKSTVRVAQPKDEFQADEKKKPVLKPKAAPEEKPAKELKPKSDDAAPAADAPAAAEKAPAEAPAADAPAADAPAEKTPASEPTAAAATADAPAEDNAPAADAPANEVAASDATPASADADKA